MTRRLGRPWKSITGTTSFYWRNSMTESVLGLRAMQTIRSMKLPSYVRTVLVHQSPDEDFIIPVHPSTNVIAVVDVETGSVLGAVSLEAQTPRESMSNRTTVETDSGIVEI
jgi:hypothetical protein